MLGFETITKEVAVGPDAPGPAVGDEIPVGERACIEPGRDDGGRRGHHTGRTPCGGPDSSV